MPTSWFGKKDQGDVDPSDESADTEGDRSGEFEQLTGYLGQLKELMGQADDRITAYLMWRDSQSSGAEPASTGSLEDKLKCLSEKLDVLATGASSGPGPAESDGAAAQVDGGAQLNEQDIKAILDPLGEKLSAVEAGLRSLSEAAAKQVSSEADSGLSLVDVIGAVNGQSAGFNELFKQLERQLANGFGRIIELVTTDEPEEDTGPTGSTSEWQKAILGVDLTANPALAFKRQELLDGVLAGNPSARAFAGQLLVFQSAPAERLPQLLKDMGEAYYRWQPKNEPGTNPLEDALVQWLRTTCEAAGIGNTVELVHPGERFDSSRHNATTRGVEITDVHGWIVLRDNGRVYTKASVVVR